MIKSLDKLTGFIDGSELASSVDALIAQNVEFALIMMDIDNLQSINQDFGTDGGDAVFRLIAKSVDALFFAPCAAFRDGADTFEILMPAMGKEEAFLAAEQLRKEVAAEQLDFSAADGRALAQSVSIGIASYPEDGSRMADIYRRAHSAMVRAKKAGRNRVMLAREEKLMPKTSHYTAAQLEQLSEIAEKIAVGEAALLREALDDLLRKYDTD